MAIHFYTGTSHADTITPTTVSAGVIADPPGTKPSDAADTISGLGGGDTLSGGGGNDGVFAWGAGNTLHGDAGDDYIDIRMTDTGGANPVTNTAWGDGGNDTISLTYYSNLDLFPQGGWHGQDPTGTITMHGGGGNDTLGVYGSYDAFPDLAGTAVFLYGDAGNDNLFASSLDPDGDGTYYAGNNPDHLYGGPGDDTYHIFDSKDVVVEKAGEGYDTVSVAESSYFGTATGLTDYVLPANVEKMVLYYNYMDSPPSGGFHGTGNALDNVIVGTDRAERLDGQAGDDTIYGGAGGSGDSDIIYGGAGNDLIYGASGPDQIYGDDGNDRIFGQFGDDVLYGGPGNDSLAGQAGNDTLWGGAGNDHLGGGTGDDMLYGEDGDDVITGRCGRRYAQRWRRQRPLRLRGYIANSKPGAGNHDTILDLRRRRIDLAQIDADATKGGNQAFTFVGTTRGLKAGQLHVVAGGGTDSLVQGEVDSKAGRRLSRSWSTMIPTTPADWTAADFIL